MSDSQASVFIVDDNTDVLSAFQLMLKRAGFDVKVFGCGQSALDAANESAPDAMIVDINLPVNSGIWLAEQVRNSFSDQAIVLVAISGDDRRQLRANCIQSGFDLFFAKPFRFGVVCQHLKELLASSSLLKPAGDSESPNDSDEGVGTKTASG